MSSAIRCGLSWSAAPRIGYGQACVSAWPRRCCHSSTEAQSCYPPIGRLWSMRRKRRPSWHACAVALSGAAPMAMTFGLRPQQLGSDWSIPCVLAVARARNNRNVILRRKACSLNKSYVPFGSPLAPPAWRLPPWLSTIADDTQVNGFSLHMYRNHFTFRIPYD